MSMPFAKGPFCLNFYGPPCAEQNFKGDSTLSVLTFFDVVTVKLSHVLYGLSVVQQTIRCQVHFNNKKAYGDTLDVQIEFGS